LLTAEGRKIVKRANRAGVALKNQMLATFGEDEFNNVVGKLHQMKETLDEERS